NLVTPGKDPPGHVLHFFEPGLAQEVARFSAADAALAVRDDFDGAVEFAHALRQIAQWNELRGRNTADLILVGLAHIEQQEAIATIEFRFYFNGIDLALPKIRRDRSRLMLRDSAEFL